jgi:TRAP-type C4-dicarboxylate transport system permease small subunit
MTPEEFSKLPHEDMIRFLNQSLRRRIHTLIIGCIAMIVLALALGAWNYIATDHPQWRKISIFFDGVGVGFFVALIFNCFRLLKRLKKHE